MNANRILLLVAATLLIPLFGAPGAVATQNCPVQEDGLMVCRDDTTLGIWVRLPEGTWVFVYAYALAFTGSEHCTGLHVIVDQLTIFANYYCLTLTNDPGVRVHFGVLSIWLNARADGNEVCYAIAQGSWNCLTLANPAE